MKKLVSVQEVPNEGLEGLLGERVLLMCSSYFYTGILSGVNESFVQLEEAAIVYETGAWTKNGYTDAQKLHTKVWYVQRAAIESFGLSK